MKALMCLIVAAITLSALPVFADTPDVRWFITFTGKTSSTVEMQPTSRDGSGVVLPNDLTPKNTICTLSNDRHGPGKIHSRVLTCLSLNGSNFQQLEVMCAPESPQEKSINVWLVPQIRETVTLECIAGNTFITSREWIN